jgi:hypothetical protein
MRTKLTIEQLRDYCLPQRRITAERNIEKTCAEAIESRNFNDSTPHYWQGYRDAIKSVEQLIKENEP